MFYLGLIAAVCWLPGYTGATVPTQWVLFSLALPAWLWRDARLTTAHWLMLAFTGFAALSLIWAKSLFDGIYELWLICIWGLAFWLGTVEDDLSDLWRGLAVGLSVSSAITIIQALGYNPFEMNGGAPAGLLYNSTVLGAVIAITILALAAHRLWLYIPALLPGLILCHSRGAIGVLLIAFVWRHIHWALALGLALSGAFFTLLHLNPADAQRLQVWTSTWHQLSPVGWGAGSYNSFYYALPGGWIHPEFVHNDPLQLWFNYGPVALLPIYILALALLRPGPDHWPLFAITILSLFWFPLFTPLTSFMAWTCAGHLLRRDGIFSDLSRGRRSRILLRLTEATPGLRPFGSRNLSVQS